MSCCAYQPMHFPCLPVNTPAYTRIHTFSYKFPSISVNPLSFAYKLLHCPMCLPAHSLSCDNQPMHCPVCFPVHELSCAYPPMHFPVLTSPCTFLWLPAHALSCVYPPITFLCLPAHALSCDYPHMLFHVPIHSPIFIRPCFSCLWKTTSFPVFASSCNFLVAFLLFPYALHHKKYIIYCFFAIFPLLWCQLTCESV